MHVHSMSLDFAFYTGSNDGGHEDSLSLIAPAGSTQFGKTARVCLRLSKYPKLSIANVAEFSFACPLRSLR